MGGLVSGAFGDTGASDEAARAQIFAIQQGIEEVKRQFAVTQGNVDPFLQAGQGAVPGVQQASTIPGFGQRIDEIFQGGSLDPLIDRRTQAAQNQLGAGGLTRSGQGLETIANIPTELAFQLEQLLSDRGSNLAQTGLSSALGLGQLGAQSSSQIAGLNSDIGAVRSAGILGENEARVGQANSIFQGLTDLFSTASGAGAFGGGGGGGFSGLAGGAGGGGLSSLSFGESGGGSFFGNQAVGGLGSSAGTSSLFFSDPMLKDNVEEVGRAGKLGIYQWDWKPETRGTMIEGCGNIGFMADEVKEHYPEFVFNFAGFDCILYPQLLEKLEAVHGSN
jgi:hypothetical protein